MEIHFVHRSKTGDLAVMGVLLQAGTFNPALQVIWDAIPEQEGLEQKIEGIDIDASQLLPTQHRFLTYVGSLTTPPCSEKVLWCIMETPIEASVAQIAKFSQIFPNNARYLQPRNDRIIIEVL